MLFLLYYDENSVTQTVLVLLRYRYLHKVVIIHFVHGRESMGLFMCDFDQIRILVMVHRIYV